MKISKIEQLRQDILGHSPGQQQALCRILSPQVLALIRLCSKVSKDFTRNQEKEHPVVLGTRH